MGASQSRFANAVPRLLLLALIAGLSAAPLLLSPFASPTTILWIEARNAAHTLIFVPIALLFLLVLTSTDDHSAAIPGRRYWQALVLCIIFGAGTEAVQFFLPRDADVVDFLRNIAGATFALLTYRSYNLVRHGRALSLRDRLLLILGTLVLLVSISTFIGWAVSYLERDSRFPLVADFEPRPWPTFVTPKGGRLRSVPAPSAFSKNANGRTLEVAFTHTKWPGFSIQEPYPDWSGYSSLAFEVFNPTSAVHALHIRIDDALYTDGYEDRYNGIFNISPGANSVRVNLRDVRNGPESRRLDLSRISTIIVFAENNQAPFVLFFDNFRLLQ